MSLDAFIAYAFNRRFMVEVLGNEVWQAISPDPGLGQHLTTLSYGLAGFEHLTKQGLYRVGLYYSALFDTFAGPHVVGAKQDDVQYDITIANASRCSNPGPRTAPCW